MIRRHAEGDLGPGHPDRAAAAWLSILLAIGVGGCAFGPPGGGWVGAEIQIPEPIEIPPGSAHTSFQGGRQVSGVDLLDRYCEIEINTVSEVAQWSTTGASRVVREGFSLLQDPITRIPAFITGFNCSDPLFQESLWRLEGAVDSNVRSLRCIAPYFDCLVGPPVSLPQAREIVGPWIRMPGLE